MAVGSIRVYSSFMGALGIGAAVLLTFGACGEATTADAPRSIEQQLQDGDVNCRPDDLVESSTSEIDPRGYGKDGPPTPRDALARYFKTDGSLEDADPEAWQETEADNATEARFYLAQDDRVLGLIHVVKTGGSWIVDGHTLCESADI